MLVDGDADSILVSVVELLYKTNQGASGCDKVAARLDMAGEPAGMCEEVEDVSVDDAVMDIKTVHQALVAAPSGHIDAHLLVDGRCLTAQQRDDQQGEAEHSQGGNEEAAAVFHAMFLFLLFRHSYFSVEGASWSAGVEVRCSISWYRRVSMYLSPRSTQSFKVAQCVYPAFWKICRLGLLVAAMSAYSWCSEVLAIQKSVRRG